MMVETSKGPVDESTLDRISGHDDTDRYYGPWVELRERGTGETLARYEQRDPTKGGWLKVNPFAEPADGVLCEWNGKRVVLPEAELVKTVGCTDNAIEYTWSVEYRLADDPTGDIVHRSVDVKLKRPAFNAEGAAAQL